MTGIVIMTLPRTRDEALALLGKREAEERRLAVRSLAEVPEIAGSVLLEALADEDWRVRKQAVALAQTIADRVDVITRLVDVLAGPAEHVALRNAAVEALSGLGDRAVTAVERALGTSRLDADGRKLAIEVLGASRSPTALPALVSALDDDDANVRGAAAEAIGLLGGEGAASALVRLLSREDRFLRLAALEALQRIGARVPASMVEQFLDDRVTRAAAISLLGRSADESAASPLARALGDPSRHVGEAAARALGTLLEDAPELRGVIARALIEAGGEARARVVQMSEAEPVADRAAAIELLSLLPDEGALDIVACALLDDATAERATVALASAAERGVAAVRRAIAKAEGASRAALVSVLPQLLPPPLDEARMALRDADPGVAAAGASAYAQLLARAELGPTAAAATDVRALVAAATSNDSRLSALALSALRTLARHAPDVVRPHLVEGTDGPIEPRDDRAAIPCALLAVVGGEEHVAWLSRAISASSARVRRAAVEALGAIGGTAAAEAIALAVTDESLDVALAAIKALGKVRDHAGGAPGVPTLRQLVASSGSDDRTRAVHAAAVRALGATGDRGSASALRPLLASADPTIVCGALDALADLEIEDLRAVAIGCFSHPAATVVRAALDVIEEFIEQGDAALGEQLEAALLHPAWEVRRRAVELLARIPDPSVRRMLAARAPAEPEFAVREAIAQAIGSTEPRASRSTPPGPSTTDKSGGN